MRARRTGRGRTGQAATTRPARASWGRCLVVAAAGDLLEDVRRLAAAVGTEIEVVGDPVVARARWSSAPIVLVGADVAGALASAQFPRRRDVVLVTRDRDDADVWQVGVRIGADLVAELPSDEARVVEALADAAERRGPLAPVVCTIGGRGGAGASTLAAGLAVTAGDRDATAVLVDADPLGGGLDVLLGCEHAAGLRWPQLAAARGRVSASSLLTGLPQVGGVATLAWHRGAPLQLPPDAMASVLDACRRSADLVVVDLPRHLDDAARAALARSVVTLVVVPAEVRATAAAVAVCAAVCALTDDVRIVVRGPAPSGLTGPAVAEALALPLLGYLPPEPGLPSALERGEPPGRGRGPISRLAGTLLTELAERRGG